MEVIHNSATALAVVFFSICFALAVFISRADDAFRDRTAHSATRQNGPHPYKISAIACG
jgi:preprotein translocase subunit SecG